MPSHLQKHQQKQQKKKQNYRKSLGWNTTHENSLHFTESWKENDSINNSIISQNTNQVYEWLKMTKIIKKKTNTEKKMKSEIAEI